MSQTPIFDSVVEDFAKRGKHYKDLVDDFYSRQRQYKNPVMMERPRPMEQDESYVGQWPVTSTQPMLIGDIIDGLVKGYVDRNPHADPADIEIQTDEGGSMKVVAKTAEPDTIVVMPLHKKDEAPNQE